MLEPNPNDIRADLSGKPRISLKPEHSIQPGFSPREGNGETSGIKPLDSSFDFQLKQEGSWNRKRGCILGAGLSVIACILLFPPWICKGWTFEPSPGMGPHVGWKEIEVRAFGFFVYPPVSDAIINYQMLVMEVFLAAIVTAVLVFLFPANRATAIEYVIWGSIIILLSIVIVVEFNRVDHQYLFNEPGSVSYGPLGQG